MSKNKYSRSWGQGGLNSEVISILKQYNTYSGY